jgi:hypothetical protein
MVIMHAIKNKISNSCSIEYPLVYEHVCGVCVCVCVNTHIHKMILEGHFVYNYCWNLAIVEVFLIKTTLSEVSFTSVFR